MNCSRAKIQANTVDAEAMGAKLSDAYESFRDDRDGGSMEPDASGGVTVAYDQDGQDEHKCDQEHSANVPCRVPKFLQRQKWLERHQSDCLNVRANLCLSCWKPHHCAPMND